MSKIFLAFVLGFVLNSGLRSYYSYLWWSTEAKLTNTQMEESFEAHGYYKIIYDSIGIQDNIKYVLIYPSYTARKWMRQYP